MFYTYYLIADQISITKMGASKVGVTTSLNCTVDVQATEEMFLISWKHEKSSISLINTSSSSTLWFNPLIASHAGIYICNTSLDFTSGSERINLTIKCKLMISMSAVIMAIMAMFNNCSGHGHEDISEHN